MFFKLYVLVFLILDNKRESSLTSKRCHGNWFHTHSIGIHCISIPSLPMSTFLTLRQPSLLSLVQKQVLLLLCSFLGASKTKTAPTKCVFAQQSLGITRYWQRHAFLLHSTQRCLLDLLLKSASNPRNPVACRCISPISFLCRVFSLCHFYSPHILVNVCPKFHFL